MSDADPPFIERRKKRGRPPVIERRSSVSTWLPASYHDRLIRLANQNGRSVSATVRQLLILRLPPPETLP